MTLHNRRTAMLMLFAIEWFRVKFKKVTKFLFALCPLQSLEWSWGEHKQGLIGLRLNVGSRVSFERLEARKDLTLTAHGSFELDKH